MPAAVSKFRHVFAPKPKPDQLYTQVKTSSTIWDMSNFLAASSQNIAMAWASGGGGRLAILPIASPGKINDPFSFTGFSGPVLDWKFHPFNDNLLASGSEDCLVRVWTIPEGGMTQNINDPSITLQGHGKKVGILHFHPAAEHVLMTAGMDHAIKFWDIEKGEKFSIEKHTDQITSFDFNLDVSSLVTTCKDKKIRLVDPRSKEVTAETAGHQGSKASKAVWAKRKDRIITVGFSRSQERQMFVWDPRKMEEKLYEMEIDNASGVFLTHYDEDTNMLYLGGKGDGNIRYYELWDNEPCVTPLAEHMTGTPQRGIAFMPKRACDTSTCEVARVFKLENAQITPFSFQCPRKQAAIEFQADVYPETFSSTPAGSADDYFGGKNFPPSTMSMQNVEAGTASASFRPSSDKPISAAEVDAQKAKVEALKTQLAKEEGILAEMQEKLGGQ